MCVGVGHEKYLNQMRKEKDKVRKREGREKESIIRKRILFNVRQN